MGSTNHQAAHSTVDKATLVAFEVAPEDLTAVIASLEYQ